MFKFKLKELIQGAVNGCKYMCVGPDNSGIFYDKKELISSLNSSGETVRTYAQAQRLFKYNIGTLERAIAVHWAGGWPVVNCQLDNAEELAALSEVELMILAKCIRNIKRKK